MPRHVSGAQSLGALSISAAILAAASLAPAPAAADPMFQDVTSSSGVATFTPTINNDASPAVFPAFFKAIGELVFPDPAFCGATTSEPTCEFGPSAYIGGVLIADFNNDGRNDIFATNADDGANALFINQGNDNSGNPTFIDMAAAKGAGFAADQGSAAVAGDVNNDGWVDLYISNIGFDPATEFARTSPAFAALGALTEADLGPAATNNPGFNRLLINQGSIGGVWQGFAEAASAAGAGGVASTRSTSPSMVDFDNDGDLDIFVAAHTNVFLIPTPTNFPIWGNDGIFVGPLVKRVADISCFGDEDGETGLGDGVDNDGSCVPSGGNLLFRNMFKESGTLAFVDATDLLRNAIDTATGQPNKGADGRPYIDSFMAFDGVWFDYDNNGFADLVISNDADFVGVFRNVDGASFELVSRTALLDPGKDTSIFGDVGAVGAWMAISHGDVNGDGLIDFYATNAGAGGLDGTAFTQPLHALYVNRGNGTFIDVATEVDRHEVKMGDPLASLGHPALDDGTTGMPETLNGHFAFGGQLFDMDNDGDLDIFNIGNLFGSGVGTRASDPNGGDLDILESRGFRVTNNGTLFANEGSVTEVTFDNANLPGAITVDVPDMDHVTETQAERDAAGIDNPFDGRGLAIGDLNNDGYVDIVTANVSGVGADSFDPFAKTIGTYNGGLRVFRNNGAGNRSLVLRLQGTRSNKSGIGARVTVDAGDGPIVRELSSNTGHRGNASLELLVGVGDASSVDVKIDWPSGAVQDLGSIGLGGHRTCFRVVEHDLSKGESSRRDIRASLKKCK